MDSIDLEVLRTSVQWLATGHKVTLVTVAKTWGSSPRPVGAMLAVRADGIVSGSVSGGCIEDDLIARACSHSLTGNKPEVVTYGITQDEARRFGLPCGGTMQLVLEPLAPDGPISMLLAKVERRELLIRELDIQTGAWIVKHAPATDTQIFDGKTLVSSFGPRYRMLIIGAGQLSRFIAEIAVGMDYQVTVCDPREEFSESWKVAGVSLVNTMPDDTVIAMRLDARTAVIALTHDPKLDDMALMEALKSDAFYIGAIGSRINNERRRERLKELDLTDIEIARLKGPIGIYIDSRTPPEIAISILAEMTAVKNGVKLPREAAVSEAKNQARSPACLI